MTAQVGMLYGNIIEFGVAEDYLSLQGKGHQPIPNKVILPYRMPDRWKLFVSYSLINLINGLISYQAIIFRGVIYFYVGIHPPATYV